MNVGILIIVFILIFMFVSVWNIQKKVYGPVLNEEEVDAFLSKNFERYEYNEYSWKNGRMMYSPNSIKDIELPYIAKIHGSFGVWYIADYGRIPKHSPWTKILEAKFENLPENTNKPLSEL